ncbi:MAG: hypothetical protein GY799_02360 [Desulfobulbaceae bacterium]|nr:hypothetical protein [Desulfobulbaceae bacterium]
MNTYEIPIIASSSEAAGAKNVLLDGSSFEILLQQPIIMPHNLGNCTIQVDEATVWWTIPNISAALGNNMFYFTHLATPYPITIPDGLYSVSDLNNAVDRELVAASGLSGLVTFAADNATQKVEIIINQAGSIIDFTPLDTFRDIIGFDSQIIPLTTGSYSQLGDNVAAFNTIEYFLLHCDIVGQGIRTNDTYSQTIAQILIDVKPGSQIVSREFNPPKSEALHLAGQTIDRIKFWLTDQNNVEVNTHDEVFGCRMIIKYTLF